MWKGLYSSPVDASAFIRVAKEKLANNVLYPERKRPPESEDQRLVGDIGLETQHHSADLPLAPKHNLMERPLSTSS